MFQEISVEAGFPSFAVPREYNPWDDRPRARQMIQAALLAEKGPEGHFQFPEDDPEVINLLAQGRTAGIIFFELEAHRQVLKKVPLRSRQELPVLVQLCSSYSIQYDLVEHYESLRNNPREEYSAWESELAETFGMILFREQWEAVVQAFAGFSQEEARDIRRTMGKRDWEKLEASHRRFIDEAQKQGRGRGEAESLWMTLSEAARWVGSRKAAAEMAQLVYRMAFLKVHCEESFRMVLDDRRFWL
jgi:DNA polymerase III subunit alpha